MKCKCGSTMTDYGAPIGWCCDRGFDCPVHIKNMAEIYGSDKNIYSDRKVGAMTDDGLVEVKPFIPGQFYTNHEGVRFVYIGENPIAKDDIKYVFANERGWSWSVDRDGKSHDDEDYDIIGEWKEPVKCWVVHDSNKGICYILEKEESAKLKALEGYQVKEVTF